jgi:hypothetical protein
MNGIHDRGVKSLDNWAVSAQIKDRLGPPTAGFRGQT